MTMKLFNTSSVQDIANAIRARNGLSRTYKIAEMASAVSAIATDGTATADKILSGYTAYGLSGQKMVGTASDSGGTAIVVTDEPDEHGGTIRYINGVSLDGDTVSAGTLFSGVTAHNNLGSSIVGTYVPPTIGEWIGYGQKMRTTIFPPDGVDAMSTFIVDRTQFGYVNIVPSESSQVITPPSDTLVYEIVTSDTSSTGGKYTKSFTFPTSDHAKYRLKGEVTRQGYEFPFVIDFTFAMPCYYDNGAWYNYNDEQVDSSYEIARAIQTNDGGGIEIILTLSSLTLDIGGNYNITVHPTGLYEPSNYDGYNYIDVEPISSTYVGSGIPSMSSSNLAFATGTGVFTAPSGYYSTNATYTLTPKTSTNIAFNSGTGVFTVTSGYYSSSPTLTLSTKAGTTITPSSTSQIAISSGYFATGSIYVASATGGDYYSWYKELADRYTTILLSSFSSATFNQYSRVNAYQFAYTHFVGSATFENVANISEHGFERAFTATQTGTTNYLSFPNCSIIGSYAFSGCTLAGIYLPLITSIPSYAFSNCYVLSSLVTGSITYVGTSAFYGCSSLSQFPDLTNCTRIDSGAFYNCASMTSLSVPNLSIIPSYMCYSCRTLSTIYAPECEKISAYAFVNCSSLESISLPLCTSIAGYAFSSCYALSIISLPNLQSTDTGAFRECTGISFIDLPNCKIISAYIMYGCTSLNTVITRAATSFGNQAFASCYNLLSLYILGSTMASFGTNMFNSTPISSYTTSTGGVYGSIYVPESLYNTYVNNTSWKPYSARFVSLTDAQIALI